MEHAQKEMMVSVNTHFHCMEKDAMKVRFLRLPVPNISFCAQLKKQSNKSGRVKDDSLHVWVNYSFNEMRRTSVMIIYDANNSQW